MVATRSARRAKPKTNIPNCVIISGSFTVTATTGAVAITSGYADKGWTVARAAAGVYRVTLTDGTFATAPLLFVRHKLLTASNEASVHVMDGGTLTADGVTGNTFDIQLINAATDTLIDPATDDISISFLAVFNNSGSIAPTRHPYKPINGVNLPGMEVVFGSFTVTTGGTVAQVSGYNQQWSVAEGAAGRYRVTFEGVYAAAPVLILGKKCGHADDNSLRLFDSSVSSPTAGTSVDICVANTNSDTLVRPTGGTMTINFMAIFNNSGLLGTAATRTARNETILTNMEKMEIVAGSFTVNPTTGACASVSGYSAGHTVALEGSVDTVDGTADDFVARVTINDTYGKVPLLFTTKKVSSGTADNSLQLVDLGATNADGISEAAPTTGNMFDVAVIDGTADTYVLIATALGASITCHFAAFFDNV